MSLFSAKKDILVALFDITSSSIGGLLLNHHPDKLPDILGSERFSTDFFPSFDFQKNLRSIHRTFEKAVAVLRKKMPAGKKRPDRVMIVFSSPYYVSQTKFIRVSKTEPFKVTEQLIHKIIGEETTAFEKKWQKNSPSEILEREIMQISLNGYPVKQAIGRRAKNLEISLYMSLGIKVIRDKLHECILHSFGEMPVSFHSFPLVAFGAMKDIIDIDKGLILIDVGGEITDLIMMRNKILEEVISFPWGENLLIRKIAKIFGYSLEESFFLLNQHIRGDLYLKTNDKVRKIVNEAAAKWCGFFDKAFIDSPDLPKNIVFIGGKGALALKDFAPCTTDPAFKSQFLFSESLRNHFAFRKGFGESKDILLTLSALFADKLLLNA